MIENPRFAEGFLSQPHVGEVVFDEQDLDGPAGRQLLDHAASFLGADGSVK